MRSEYVSAECRKEKCALTLYRGFVLQDFYDMWGHLASGTFAACRKSLPAYGLALLEKVASRLCLLLHFGSSRLDVGETCCGGSARHASTMVFDSMKVQRCLGLKWYDALKALYTSEVLQRLSMMKCEENFYTKFHVISIHLWPEQCHPILLGVARQLRQVSVVAACLRSRQYIGQPAQFLQDIKPGKSVLCHLMLRRSSGLAQSRPTGQTLRLWLSGNTVP